MEKEIITVTSERFSEFASKLSDALKQNGCEMTREKPKAKAILEEMGNVNVSETLRYFELLGGYCDCEIMFNVF